MVINWLRVHVPPHPLGMQYIRFTWDWALIIVKLTVLIMQVDEADCISTRFWFFISIPYLIKEENNVWNVGDVAQSEKSPENSQ